MTENESPRNINRLLDVEMNVTVRFGKTEMPLKEVVHFSVGSMLELNRTVDEPVELLVNNYPFARGEVVVIDGYYGVRVTEIGTAEERTQSLFPTPDDEKPMASAELFQTEDFASTTDESSASDEVAAETEAPTHDDSVETDDVQPEPAVETDQSEQPAEEE